MHSSNYTNISTISNHNPPFPENDINRSCSISSKFQDPNSNNFMFNFPNSPHIHLEYEEAYNQFLELFDQHKSIELNQKPPVPTTEITAVDDYQPPSTTAAAAAAAGRKRFGKKDRHSKINTARGPRDRRMRLSLEVARKFFDLQDSLGFDKASRTVDWLLKNSKTAIRELKRSNGTTGGGSCSFNMGGGAPAHSGSVSVSSDGCEVVSSNHSTITTAGGAAVVEPHPPPPPPTKPKRSKKIRVARATVAKDSRKRARERARERTSQKRRLVINEINTIQPKILISKSLTESHGSCSRAPMQHSTESQDLNSDQTRPNPLVYSATWNSSAILDNYQDNAGLFSHQIPDEFDQYCGKPWEAYSSSFNLSG